MALHELRIVFVDVGKADGFASGDSGDGTSTKSKKKTALQKVLNLNTTIKDAIQKDMSPVEQMTMNQTVALAKQVGRSTFNYWVSDIGRRNGDSNYQAQINRKIEQVTDVTNIVGAVLSGAASGAMVGGPVGAIVGGIIGIASSAISLGFRQLERERAYAHEMFKENNNQAVQLARANYSALTGRVR